MHSSKIEHTLKTPVKLSSGALLETVILEEIEIGRMIEIEETDVSDSQQGIMVLAAMAGLDLADFKKIKTSDALAIKKKTEEAWGNGSTDGGKSPS